VASPELPGLLTESGAFPIVSAYLRLAGEGARVQAFRVDGSFWADVGSAEKLERVRKLANEGRLPA
jgi:NDP-sugar pyrophosphorylase family protein